MWWQESNVLEHWILDVGGKPVSFSQTQSQLLSTSTIIRYHKSHKYSTSCQIQINVDPTTKDKCLQLNIEYPHICIYIIYIYINPIWNVILLAQIGSPERPSFSEILEQDEGSCGRACMLVWLPSNFGSRSELSLGDDKLMSAMGLKPEHFLGEKNTSTD